MTTGTDAELMAQSIATPSAFEALVIRHHGVIYRYVARRLGPVTAEDVVSEVFTTAFAIRSRYDADRPDARPWLFGIATNMIRRHRIDGLLVEIAGTGRLSIAVPRIMPGPALEDLIARATDGSIELTMVTTEAESHVERFPAPSIGGRLTIESDATSGVLVGRTDTQVATVAAIVARTGAVIAMTGKTGDGRIANGWYLLPVGGALSSEIKIAGVGEDGAPLMTTNPGYSIRVGG